MREEWLEGSGKGGMPLNVRLVPGRAASGIGEPIVSVGMDRASLPGAPSVRSSTPRIALGEALLRDPRGEEPSSTVQNISDGRELGVEGSPLGGFPAGDWAPIGTSLAWVVLVEVAGMGVCAVGMGVCAAASSLSSMSASTLVVRIPATARLAEMEWRGDTAPLATRFLA